MSSQEVSTTTSQETFALETPTQLGDALAATERLWRNSVIAFLVTLAGCLISVAIVNFLVNPLGVYPTRWLPPMVWNGRTEKVTALEAEEPKPKALVFGSSHVWAVAPAKLQELTGLPSFNAGVSVAMTEDYYALLRYTVEQAGARPELVIIGLDIEALHNGAPVDPRSQKVWALRAYLPRSSMSSDVSRLKPLMTMQSTQLSARSIRLALRGRAGTPADPIYTVGPHGDTHLSAIEHQLATGQTTREKELQINIQTYLRRWEGFTALSEVRLKYLRRTLDYCAKRNIRTIIYLTPLHPELQLALEQRGYKTRRREVVERVERMASETGASFFDFTDVASFGGSPDGFLDGAHMDQKSGALLAEHLLKDAHVIQ